LVLEERLLRVELHLEVWVLQEHWVKEEMDTIFMAAAAAADITAAAVEATAAVAVVHRG
jgi:hypothetical protein